MMIHRERTGLELRATIDCIAERIERLMVSSPNRFTVPLSDYGKNTYT